MRFDYNVIVVGAGHAGCEAAAAAANMGSRVLLITMDMDKMAQMSCNPAVGGIAKGQIVREIDALGGQMGIITDRTSIQFRLLNRSKGPAMWSPRVQSDRIKFSNEWRKTLEQTENLRFWQDMVTELVLEDGVAKGVKTKLGMTFNADTVILTNGTFLNGLMHIGGTKLTGGRMGDSASTGLSEQLFSAGFEVGRMKTGTPARLDGRTIDFSVMTEQEGELDHHTFSYIKQENNLTKRSCYITHTSKEVHDTLKKGFEESPLFNGTINSIGPRYCPSIEDKVVTFAEKDKHQLFIEPEGESTIEFYINGFSSSLPWKVQLEALRKVRGLENVEIFRPGYAIEYDFFLPTQLNHTLETKLIKNLYFAGQINGTTGYEEAGGQGLIAGINASLKHRGKDEFILNRDEAYIGVLIDDLVTKGVDEPYRMFTSRAEYRILLRQDNADERLTQKGVDLGLAKKERLEVIKNKKAHRENLISILKKSSIKPKEVNPLLVKLKTSEINQTVKLERILSRPQVGLKDLIEISKDLSDYINEIDSDKDVIIESTEILIKYQGYIDREKAVADKLSRLEHINIKADFDYHQLKSLSTEARQKLSSIKPETIGQASRISGVSPADISVLLVYFGR
jgi:tRNA uridine 5-carboxymethylaminomethyl modification enzyme